MDLKKIIENEYFIACPFLPTDRFITYCKNRDIKTSREHLEKLEKLGIFYPMARVSFQKTKRKIEYIDGKHQYRDLGPLTDEHWTGETLEVYPHFWFEKEYALNWFENKILWDPRTSPFQEWDSFKDEQGRNKIESYYSLFQCSTLYELIRCSTFELGAEWWCTLDEKTIQSKISKISQRANDIIKLKQKYIRETDIIPLTCQVISNRYYPHSQTDKRTIRLSFGALYHDWDWDDYCQNWNASEVLSGLGLTIEDIRNQHQTISMESSRCDPLEKWFPLVNFVSVEKKHLLKGKALLAQTLYSMEHMLRIFFEELTGDKLHSPGESDVWSRSEIYGESVIENNMKYLQFLANEYHINPKPKLILVVEGEGEYMEIPRLSKQLLGRDFSDLGIEVLDIRGIGGYTGKEVLDPYGALEKFIDYHHFCQTIVVVVLDNEGRAKQTTEKILKAKSKSFPRRSLTKSEYIHLWEQKTIEFSNFTNEEIASAMTQVGEYRYIFQLSEIQDCRSECLKEDKPTLSNIYKAKLSYGLPKKDLLRVLFDMIITNAQTEVNGIDEQVRPIIRLIKKITRLAMLNHQPVNEDIWAKNQESGYLGEV